MADAGVCQVGCRVRVYKECLKENSIFSDFCRLTEHNHGSFSAQSGLFPHPVVLDDANQPFGANFAPALWVREHVIAKDLQVGSIKDDYEAKT